ncbi:MAG: S-layer homology domain-containing protein, partial [Acidimicrobiia bacterium]
MINRSRGVFAASVIGLLAVLLLWQATGGALAANTFIDDDDSVHEADIETIAAEGITKGCNPPDNDRYCPDDPDTRGQMAAFLRRALELPASSQDSFTDDDDSIFEEDINAIAEAGITKGCNPPDNDRYCPDDHVTRGQMAAFLVRAFGYDDPGSGDHFVDDDDSVFEGDIDRLFVAGVTKGCNPPENDRYCPLDDVTRAQMASFLARALVEAGLITTTTTTTTTSTSTTTTSLPPVPGGGPGLFLSDSATRQPADLLEGETVGGDIYVFVGPDEGVTQVRFFVNDPTRSGTPYRVENFEKFDLEATAADGNANPSDSFRLDNGTNDVTAEVVLDDGSTKVVSAGFTVSNGSGLQLDRHEEGFTLKAGNVSAPKTVQVSTNDGSPLPDWTASKSGSPTPSWLTISKADATTLSLSADTAGLSPGVWTATVTVSAGGFQSAELTVTLTVTDPGNCSPLSCDQVPVTPPYTLEFEASVANT